jgi:hypothetical protein
MTVGMKVGDDVEKEDDDDEDDEDERNFALITG